MSTLSNQFQNQQTHIQFSMNYQLKKSRLFVSSLFLFLLSFGSVQAQVQTARTNVSITSNTNGFYEYLPQGYSATGTTTYPLIIMIHGMGEYGNGSTSLPLVKKHGVPHEISVGRFPTSFTVNGQTFKFIVISPQWLRQASAANINGVIDYALAHYKVDSKRIYLTGLSAGGGVVENAACDLTVSKRIAAVVEFCGTGYATTTKATTIVNNNVSFWGIHNVHDDEVSSSKTTAWVNDIIGVKSSAAAKKTMPNASGHNCWSSRYVATWKENNMNIYEWMLQYQKGTVPPPPTNVAPVANAGSDKTITLPASSVTLAGSGTDNDGTISKYSWTKVAGPATCLFSSTIIANPTVSTLVAGTYTFRLTVTDNKGATDYDDVNVVVNPVVPVNTTFSIPGKVEGENYNSMLGVQKESTTDAGGGQDVGYIDLNDWIDYSVKTTAAGTFNITFRVASGNSTGSQFQVKNSSGTVLATVTVPATGGYQAWRDVTASVNLASGTQTLRLFSINAPRWNINYMNFTSSTASVGDPTDTTKIEAETYVYMDGVQTENTSDAGGGQDVGYIDLNDWMDFNLDLASAGTYTFTFRVATNVADVKFNVYDYYNSVKSFIDSVKVPNTGGWQTWKDVTVSLELPAGAQRLQLYTTGTGRWNLNYFTYGLSTTTGPTTSTTLAANAVTRDVAEERTITSPLSVFPNPINDKFVLQVNNPYTGTMKVQLVDASGVVRKEFQVTKSAAGSLQTYLSAGTLPAGNYFVKVQIGKWSQSKQVIKL